MNSQELRKKHSHHLVAIVILLVIAATIYLSPADFQATVRAPQIFKGTAFAYKVWDAGSTPPEIDHGDRSRKIMIFTFDAGDKATSGPGILAALAKHHVKGTFFMTGKFVENNPVLVRQIAAAGHEIFNHTYDHKDLTTLTASQVTAELDGMDEVLQSTIGSTTRPFYRPPYGARDLAVRTAAAIDGYQTVYWTLDSDDWMESRGETAQEVEDRIMSHVAPGAIVLMHLGDTITAAILDDVFTKIEAQGYSLVSLTQGL